MVSQGIANPSIRLRDGCSGSSPDGGVQQTKQKKKEENEMPTIDAAGKTVKDIQNACGFTTGNAVYKWINGACMPTIDNMVIIADMCGVTVNDIIVIVRV